jgi:hypothetical protein
MARGISKEICRKRAAGWQSIVLLAGALALIFQLTFASPHVGATEAPGAAVLAELTALTGDEHVLCASVLGGGQDNPAHSDADCSSLCCNLGQPFAAALPPPSATIGAIASRWIKLRSIARAEPQARKRFASAQPRGPPPIV